MIISKSTKILFVVSLILLQLHVLISCVLMFHPKQGRVFWLGSLFIVSATMATTIIGIQQNRNEMDQNS
jgi:hypothetical protein